MHKLPSVAPYAGKAASWQRLRGTHIGTWKPGTFRALCLNIMPPPYLQSCAVQQHMREEFYGLVTIFIHLWSAVGMASWVLVQWLIH